MVFFFSMIQLSGLLISKLINWTYLRVFSQKCLSFMISLYAPFFPPKLPSPVIWKCRKWYYKGTDVNKRGEIECISIQRSAFDYL